MNIEPLNRCFDFTDGFKHAELSHFACKGFNSIQAINIKELGKLYETVFISKLNLKRGGCLASMCFLPPED